MKLLVLLLVLMFSVNAFSHCGTCGVGGSDDHKVKGDHSGHDHDKTSGDSEEEEEEESESSVEE